MFQLPLRHLILLKYEVHEVDESKKLRSREGWQEWCVRSLDVYCLWLPTQILCKFLLSCAHWSLHKSNQIIYFALVKPHRRQHREASRQPSCCPEAFSSSCRSRAKHVLGREQIGKAASIICACIYIYMQSNTHVCMYIYKIYIYISKHTYE